MTDYWADALALFMLDYAEDRLDLQALQTIAGELGMCVDEADANLWAETYTHAQRLLSEVDADSAWDWDWMRRRSKQ